MEMSLGEMRVFCVSREMAGVWVERGFVGVLLCPFKLITVREKSDQPGDGVCAQNSFSPLIWPTGLGERLLVVRGCLMEFAQFDANVAKHLSDDTGEHAILDVQAEGVGFKHELMGCGEGACLHGIQAQRHEAAAAPFV